MSAPLYRIRNWNELYENSRSRVVSDLRWVPVPNNHDGEGYCAVMGHPNAAVIFTAWVLILQVASRCKTRGLLTRNNGQPHTAATLAIKTRGKAEWFDAALDFLSSDNVRWLEKEQKPEENGQVTAARHPSDGCPSPARHPSDGCPSPARHPSAEEGRKEWKEGRNISAPNGAGAGEGSNGRVKAEDIYDAYPRKRERAKALKAIRAVIKDGADPGYLLDRTKLFAEVAKTGDKQFIKYPQGWFSSGDYSADPDDWALTLKSKWRSKPDVQYGPNGLPKKTQYPWGETEKPTRQWLVENVEFARDYLKNFPAEFNEIEADAKKLKEATP